MAGEFHRKNAEHQGGVVTRQTAARLIDRFDCPEAELAEELKRILEEQEVRSIEVYTGEDHLAVQKDRKKHRTTLLTVAATAAGK